MKLASIARVGFLGILIIAVCGRAADTKGDSPETQVHAALMGFVQAFDNLDWPTFRACFAPDATMFHPAAPNTKRVDTREQFDQAWQGVFERIRKTSGRNAAPYMQLHPENLQITMLSPDVALATFHIFNKAEIDRRTIVFKRYGDAWKIVHIHASNLSTGEAQP
jgi:ketosteroid isomerase-like protein